MRKECSCKRPEVIDFTEKERSGVDRCPVALLVDSLLLKVIDAASTAELSA